MGIKEKLIKVMSLNVVLWMLMLLVLSGLLLCAGGVYLLLAAQMSQVQALLITGGGLIAIVALLLLVAVLASASPKQKPEEKKNVEHSTDNVIEQQLRPLLGNQTTDWAKRNSGIVTIGALTAGVLIAASPRLRAGLMGAAGPLATRQAMKYIDRLSD
ncbi:hypothetical protein SADO_15909 [Salinisphaera dokdonensis CL-ES53]|uniref:Uncharacterized protein n=1 Tax=Salinisphaera dokdonensis CL-ES53 TaxID=1304272 RepID=A0ABV2B4G8_9GAMM